MKEKSAVALRQIIFSFLIKKRAKIGKVDFFAYICQLITKQPVQGTHMSVIDQKRIAKNTLLLYVRMGLIMLISLYTSRVVLDALGEVDYGLYSAVGGVVVMFSFLSNTMSTACQRFFSFELGKENYEQLRRVFSQSLVIFFLIMLIVLLLSETAGLWFVNQKMKLAGREEAVQWVFQCAVVGFVFQIMRTPYMGMIIAREKMKVFAYISIFEAVGALVVAILLAHSASDRLKLYAMLMLSIQFVTTLFYVLYCRIFYRECKPTWQFQTGSFGHIFSFTGWEMIGSLAGVCKQYGVNVLINMFFGPVLNTPRGLAQKVYMTFVQLQTNFFMAVKPQLIKSYAVGEKKEMQKLLFQSTRLTYYLLLIVSVPLILETPMILDVWLKNVPELTVLFTRLILINALIDTFSNPLATAIQATGKNKWYQIGMGATLLAIIPVAYVGYKWLKWPVESVFIISIVFSFLAQFVRFYFVRKQVSVDTRLFLKEVVGVILVVTALCFLLPMLLQLVWSERTFWQSILVICFSILCTAVVVYVIGITRTERKHLIHFIVNKYKLIVCKQ